MKKNVASQVIGAQMITAADGTAFTGAVTVYVTGDGGTQAVGSVGAGACTHEGNGFHTYAPAQAETNYGHIAFTFIGTGAVPVTIQLYTEFPQTGDSYALANGASGFVAIKGNTADILVDTNELQTAGIAGLIGALNNITAAQVRTEIDANSTQLAALIARLTATRAGYLDKLNITGNVAASGEVTAIQNNTRVRVIVPSLMERPDAGSTAYKLHLYLYDTNGNMEAPDSAPTVTAANEAGTSRSVNLGVVALEATGHYSVTYTLSSGDAIEQLTFEWTVVEGGATRLHGVATQVVDTTAVDFTAADRAKLDTLHDTRITAARAGYLDNLSAGPTALEATLTAMKGAGWTTETLKAIKDALLTAAQVNTECDTAISDAGLVAHLTDIKGGTFSGATDSLEAIRNRGDAAWLTAAGFSTFNPASQTVDLGKINGSAPAAVKLALSAGSFITGAAVAGTLSTTEMTTDLTEATNDHFKGRIIIWTSGALKDQVTDITAYDGTTKKLTYTATTEAPGVGDTFIIV